VPHFKKEALTISGVMAFYASEIQEQITSSDGFLCRPVAVNLCIPSAIDCTANPIFEWLLQRYIKWLKN